MAEIIFSEGPYAGQQLDLAGERIVFGRSEELVDLVLADEEVSSQHAELRFEEGHWHVFDMESANGTMVNDSPIDAHTLVEGDTVTIGSTIFAFKNGDAAVVAEPEEEPAAEAVETPDEEPVVEAAAATEEEPVAEEAPAVEEEPAAEEEPVAEEEPAAEEPEPAPAPAAPPPATANEHDVELVKQMRDKADIIRAEIGKVIVGQVEVIDQVLMCIVANGHALLIGMPGMAKTLLVSTISTVLDLDFKRVQFTPDLMPTDIVGTDVLETNKDTGDKEFRFIKGPIFCNLLLADEINRTPPKTQAALLEAMQEKRVTAGNTTYKLDAPFFVLATQNPLEQEGTYPLPEAQLDRFMFNIWVDYPLQHEEEQIIGATTAGTQSEPQPIMTKYDILELQSVVKKIPVSEHVIKYVIRLVRSTRPGNDDAPEVTKTYVATGAGPRAGQCLVLAAKAMAVLDGRIHVSCADIKRAASPVLRHRILTNFAADSEGLTSVDIVQRLLEIIPEPGAEDYAK